MRARPFNRGPGIRLHLLAVVFVHGLVMVAQHRLCLAVRDQFTNTIHQRARVSVVPDNVAQENHAGHAQLLGTFHTGLESFKVAMQICEKSDALIHAAIIGQLLDKSQTRNAANPAETALQP